MLSLNLHQLSIGNQENHPIKKTKTKLIKLAEFFLIGSPAVLQGNFCCFGKRSQRFLSLGCGDGGDGDGDGGGHSSLQGQVAGQRTLTYWYTQENDDFRGFEQRKSFCRELKVEK
jgi:hypothetical protein